MLELRQSAAELVRAVVDVERRFLTDAWAGDAFQRVLRLLVQVSGSNRGILGRLIVGGEERASFQRLATVGETINSAAGASSGVRCELESLDWSQLEKEMTRAGHVALPSRVGGEECDSWWGLPCVNENGKLLGVAALSAVPEEADDEVWHLLRSLCGLCSVMIEADHLEQAKRELARQEGEARYRSFADHTTDGLFIHDLEGRMVDVNLRACEILGYERDELIGQTPMLFDPEISAEQLAHNLTLLGQGQSLFFETRHCRKDGTSFPVEIRVSPFQQNGQTYALALACDITQRKRAEQQLLASEAKFRALVINAPVAIFVKDADGRYAVANPLTCEALGKREGVEGLTDFDLLPREVAEKFHHDDLQVLASGKATQYEDLVERDGYAHYFLTAKFPLLDAEGKPASVCGLAIDITERKQAEEALRDSEERFRALVDMSSQIVWTVGPDGQVDKPVPSWQAFTGQSHEDSINEGWAQMIHPDDRDTALQEWHHCSSTSKPFEMEYRLWHAPTQGWRWTKVSGIALRNSDGSIRSWVGTHHDITEQKQAAEALQLSEARYRNFVDHATDGLFLQDHEGKVVDVNRQACTNLGYSRDELIGMTPFEYDPDLTQNVITDRLARLSNGETVKFDSRHRRKDGSIFPVEVRIRPFWVDNQRYAISLVQDITERKRAERSLRLTQFSVDHAAVAVFWVARDSTIRYVNDVACKSLNYTREELVGMSIRDITDHTASSWEERFEQIKHQRSVTFEAHHRRRDGSLFPIEVTVHFDEFDGDEFLFAFAHDITSRKEAELKFEQQTAELLHASRLSTVGEMVAALSHEVAQPLSAIGNFAAACEKVISSGSSSGQGSLSEYIEAIIKQNRRCAAILQRLRDFSKRSHDCRTQCDLAHLLQESAELVSSDLGSRGVKVEFDLPKELPAVVVDRVQLQQVVVNLLTNARDAVCAGPEGHRIITVRAGAEPQAVLFQVEDRGQGFDAVSAERLFEPFYTTKKNGMGIGLSICQSIIHEHAGTIEASPNALGGATFSVRLPIYRNAQL